MKRFQPSPALVISLIALFVALGGTSYAAINSLPKNSVGTTQLKNNAVTGRKIKDGAITAAKLNTAGLKISPEPWHEIGASGEPTFQNGWVNESAGGQTTAAFFKDPFGVVHLKGVIVSGSNSVVFTLPAGYQPAHSLGEIVIRSTGPGSLRVDSTGTVQMSSGAGAATLDGVTFTAGE